MELYYVINNFDGDTTIYRYTQEALIRAVEDGEFNEYGIFEEMPKESDTNYWG